MSPKPDSVKLLAEAKNYLDNLSFQKLKVAVDFLAYLQEKEEDAATKELLSIPDFESELQAAEVKAEAGEVVYWQDIRRNV